MKCMDCDYRSGYDCRHPANPRPVRLAATRIRTDEPCRRDIEAEAAIWANLNRPWEPHEEQFVIDHPDWPVIDVARHLRRSEGSILNMRAKLRRAGRLKRVREANKPWSSEEDRILETYYGRRACVEIAAMLPGRTPAAVWERAEKLGLRERGFRQQAV